MYKQFCWPVALLLRASFRYKMSTDKVSYFVWSGHVHGTVHIGKVLEIHTGFRHRLVTRVKYLAPRNCILTIDCKPVNCTLRISFRN